MGATDAQGLTFTSNRPLMLRPIGQVNPYLPVAQRTFHLLSDYNIRTPAEQVQNNALYLFPNVGAD
jgi:hypothetical protein